MSLIKLIAEGKLTEAETVLTTQLDKSASNLVTGYKDAAFKSIFEAHALESVENDDEEMDENGDEEEEVVVEDSDEDEDDDDLIDEEENEEE